MTPSKKPTIRKRIEEIVFEIDTGIKPRGYYVKQLLALLSPQTGEGEKKQAPNWMDCNCVCHGFDDNDGQSCPHCHPEKYPDYTVTPSEEMEKEQIKKIFEIVIRATKDFIIDKNYTAEMREKEYDRAYEMNNAFLRKHLSMQREVYEKILDDLDLMLAIGESVDDAETAKIFKNIRAELRSKLLQKEEKA